MSYCWSHWGKAMIKRSLSYIQQEDYLRRCPVLWVTSPPTSPDNILFLVTIRDPSRSPRTAQQGRGPGCHHGHAEPVQCQERPGNTTFCNFFFIIFFQFFLPFFFLSTSLCFANRIKTLTKISFSEEKHFYRPKTATCFAANTQLKAGKENIYKIQGFFFHFCFFFFLTMLKGLFRIFNLINRRSTLCIGIWCIIVFLKKQ